MSIESELAEIRKRLDELEAEIFGEDEDADEEGDEDEDEE